MKSEKDDGDDDDVTEKDDANQKYLVSTLTRPYVLVSGNINRYEKV